MKLKHNKFDILQNCLPYVKTLSGYEIDHYCIMKLPLLSCIYTDDKEIGAT